ncbi:hypothetical protein [Neorhizobium sp. JUb45]|uniref:hypothetical protein n=1 Tax=unclassified Neorhizobium TaxID=2629175 RepID=UPI00104B8172|nr:hypothetical protein [Neorhizobium sp. JUb45]TCR04405.1 hypothetical protein EDF70_102504 [Neorhizobium sp. JUb45]
MAAVFPLVGEVGPYWLGVMGSFCVEISAVAVATGKAEGKIPRRYRSVPYLLLRTAMAFAAGTLPVMLEAVNAYNAFVLGASAPLVFDRMERGNDPGK